MNSKSSFLEGTKLVRQGRDYFPTAQLSHIHQSKTISLQPIDKQKKNNAWIIPQVTKIVKGSPKLLCCVEVVRHKLELLVF